MNALLFAGLLLVSLVCVFRGVRLRPWSIALVVTWALFASMTSTSLWALFISAVVLAAVLLPLNVPAWRQRFLTTTLLAYYQRTLPHMSDTENTALEAGTVGWDGELFSGKPDWSKLLGLPWQRLSAAEQAFIDGPVETLCGMLNSWQIHHVDADLPPEVWAFLREKRFFGMIIPREYGGLGFSALAHRAVLQKVSSVCAVAGTTVAVPNSLGPGELILHYGTQEQKNHYLPRLASGEELPCFALTGPTAGSDATSIPDYGVVCHGQHQGKNVLGMRLTFDKRYITLAPVATLVGLAFRLYDPDGLLGGQADLGFCLALLPRYPDGLEIGARHFALNVPFQNGPLRGEDVFVPISALIGGPAMAGKGWRMLVEALSVGRGITLPSSSTGGAKAGSLATGAYARIRKQFNLPIGRFEGIEEALARIAGKTYATSALSRMTASAVDRGEKPAVPSAIAKCHATQMAREIITDVMDIHGGKGIMLGPRNHLGRAWQGMPVWVTVEGANILTRSMMIFGQGAIRCHPYVLREMKAARLQDAGERLHEFDALMFGHIGFALRNAVRACLLGLSFGRLAGIPAGERRLAVYYRKLTRYSAALAICADVSMAVLGGKLKQKERISARLGDVLSHLYICSAMLYRFKGQGRPAADLPLLAWAFHDAMHQVQQALGGFIDNFPNRWVGTGLRFLVFPLGRWERPPGDRLGHRVAQLLLAPSEARDRLTQGIYTSAAHGHPVGVMEAALPRVIAAEPLERRLHKAARSEGLDALTWDGRLQQALEQGLVDEAEAAELRTVRQLVQEIIAVDEFDPAELVAGQASQPPMRQSNAA
jgi:acyl-CoA dehydrogenase